MAKVLVIYGRSVPHADAVAFLTDQRHMLIGRANRMLEIAKGKLNDAQYTGVMEILEDYVGYMHEANQAKVMIETLKQK